MALAGTDSDGTIASVKVTVLPTAAQGVLYKADGTTAVTTAMALTPTEAANLVFKPTANFNGTVTVSFTVTDNENNTSAAANEVITVTPINDAPSGTNATLSFNEDSGKNFTASDFGFSDEDAGDSLSAIRIDSLPAAGSLQLSGVAVANGQVISLADLGNLSFRPAPDASASNYAKLTFSVRDQAGLFDTTPNTLTFDVTPVADAPTVTLALGSASANVITVGTGNVGSTNQGFTVTALNLNGSSGQIAINNSPNGFGVAGAASGDDAELGQSGGLSERINVVFDAPVASATVRFAWLHGGERATYTLFDKTGIAIGTGTLAGVTDVIDPAVTLTSSTGAAISRIEFSTPSGTTGNDYLINSIEFVRSKTYPLTLTATPTDIDHSESIASITVTVPAGVVLSAGTNNGNGTWTLPLTSGGDYSVAINSTTHAVTISGLSMTVAGNPTGSLALTVTATAIDGTDTETGSASLTIGDTVAPQTLDVEVSANEDPGPIDIVLRATDAASSIANFTIQSVPANGTLRYHGETVLPGQVIPSSGNEARLTFTPDLNWNGSTSFQYRASDTAGNVDLTPANVSITITPVNDAPVNTLPLSFTTAEDVAIKLSGLSVSDVDVASGIVSVTLAVSNGVLSASSVGGVTVSGSDTGTLVLSGSLANINAYLAAPASQPSYLSAKDYSGTVNLTMTTSDGGNTGTGNILTDIDSIPINVTPVADAIPGSAVSLVLGTAVVNTIDVSGSSGGLDGKSSYTYANGITISTSGNGTFNWSSGNNLGVNGAGDNGTDAQRIEGTEAITFNFPSGMQYMALRLKNADDDTVLIRSTLEAGDLSSGSGTITGAITSSSGLTLSTSNIKIQLVLEVLNAGVPTRVTIEGTENSGGTWTVSYSGITGTITKATVVSYIDGDLFNQGGNASANVTYSISTDMQSLSIGQDTAKTFSTNQNNSGFQIEYIAVDANPNGLTSYSYPVDMYAAVQDTVGTPETFTKLSLSDLPTGSSISVVRADGTYQEITPDASGIFDLSSYTSLLSTPTTTSGTDKVYLTTTSALASGFVPTLSFEVADGSSSTAKTILGGSTGSTLTGGDGSDFISGGAGNDILQGGAGNDTILGGADNDTLQGGAGNDALTGGLGSDVFAWKLGDQGTAGTPAVDTVTDFDNVTSSDKLDLRDLLQGENHTSGAGNLGNYLHFEVSGGNTTVHISSQGQFATGYDSTKEDQTIVLQNVDLVGSNTTDQAIIQDLLLRGKLQTDQS